MYLLHVNRISISVLDFEIDKMIFFFISMLLAMSLEVMAVIKIIKKEL